MRSKFYQGNDVKNFSIKSLLFLLLVASGNLWTYKKYDGMSLGLRDDVYSASLFELKAVIANIEYVKCHDQAPYYYHRLPISPWPTDNQLLLCRRTPDPREFFQPRQGILAETFVATIPQATVCGKHGFIKCGTVFVQESFNQLIPFNFAIASHYRDEEIHLQPCRHVEGTVAVLAHFLDQNYAHWFVESIGRLLLLQKSGVQYDYLYAPCNREYMRKTYELFGIPAEKIIDSYVDVGYFRADRVAYPSQGMSRVPCNTDPVYNCWGSTIFTPEWVIRGVQELFAPLLAACKDKYDFSPKIFISRADTSLRQMTNEDEIFALFEPLGFVRYTLSKLSWIEQAALFAQADCIVAAHGAGLANLIFSREGTKLVEIFQHSYDTSFFNLAQTMKTQYFWIATQPFQQILPQSSSYVDPNLIKQFIQKHQKMLLDIQ